MTESTANKNINVGTQKDIDVYIDKCTNEQLAQAGGFWRNIQREYETKASNFDILAHKYNVPVKHLKTKAKNEGWVQLSKKKRALILLTPQQLKFVDHYVVHRDSKKAAKHAGYKINATSVLKNIAIQDEIKKRTEKLCLKAEIDELYVLGQLKALVEVSMERIEVTNKDGEVIDTRLRDPQTANKALDTIGKHLGMFELKFKGEIDQRITSTEIQEQRIIIESNIDNAAEVLSILQAAGAIETPVEEIDNSEDEPILAS